MSNFFNLNHQSSAGVKNGGGRGLSVVRDLIKRGSHRLSLTLSTHLEDSLSVFAVVIYLFPFPYL